MFFFKFLLSDHTYIFKCRPDRALENILLGYDWNLFFLMSKHLLWLFNGIEINFSKDNKLVYISDIA